MEQAYSCTQHASVTCARTDMTEIEVKINDKGHKT